MKIFGWTASPVGGGSLRYRISVPLAEAQHQGLAVWHYGKSFSAGQASAIDVLIGHGLYTPDSLTLFETLQKRDDSPLLVLDHDDDYRNIRADNPALADLPNYEFYLTHLVPAAEKLLQVADLVTVSVPHLVEQYRQFTDAPIVVLPNTFDAVLLDVPQRRREPGEQLRVGWSGGTTHALDWQVEAPGIAHALRKTGARLVLMGYDPRHVVKYADNEFHDWKRNLDEYYLVLTTYHVAICPLADDMFNRSKSPLKALEASALGIPVIASDVRPYQDFIIDGETGFLIRREHEWARALRALANDEDMRLEMGAAARRHAAQFATPARAKDWIDTYQAAYQRKYGHTVPLLKSQQAVAA
jgi:glycosyltransferase involved in cell wall biosynthesis